MVQLLALLLAAFAPGGPAYAQNAVQHMAAQPKLAVLPARDTIAPVIDCGALVSPTGQQDGDTAFRVISAVVEPTHDGHPAACVVKGYAAPQTEFQLRLPLSGYAGRYLQGGCGGMCGVIGDSITPRCSNAHADDGSFAVGFNNGGHHSAGIGDGTWATGDPELRMQFAHKATHAAAVAAKAVIARFYGKRPQWNYFVGCSGGGREALMEVQRYPGDFDGVVAGSSVEMPAAMQLFLWEAQQGLDSEGHEIFTLDAVKALHEAVLKACDGLDGIPDGQIDDPRRCAFDPGRIQCRKTGQRDCLTPVQVAAARAYYRGPIDPDGTALFPGGAPYGAELGWVGRGSPTQTGKFAAQAFLQYLLLPNGLPANFSWRDWRFSRASLAKLLSAGAPYDSTDPDISAFRKAGGKLLMWQGAADNAAGVYGMLDYYQAVRDRNGGLAATRAFARMFLVPGGYHCVGGYVPYDEDFLGAVVRWVELGEAPDTIEASANLADGTIRKRPLYAYPTGTRYLGGDVNAAASFAPALPAAEPQDGFDWPGSKAATRPRHVLAER